MNPRYCLVVTCAVVCAASVVLSGCSAPKGSLKPYFMDGGNSSGDTADIQTLSAARGADQEAGLYTDLIGQLIAQNKLYAAMAHLEQRQNQFGKTDELQIFKAEILRKMGRHQEAETIYRTLLKSPYAAQAYHGLGLIYAATDPATALEYLQTAVDINPTNAAMHNDLGYAQLTMGQVALAHAEIITAYQLDDQSPLNINNYVLVLLVMGRDNQASEVAASSGVPAAAYASLERKAQTLARAAATSASLDRRPGTASEAQPLPATDSAPALPAVTAQAGRRTGLTGNAAGRAGSTPTDATSDSPNPPLSRIENRELAPDYSLRIDQ